MLAFSTAIFAGLWTGNDVTTVLLRAWWALILFLIFGAMIGWMAKVIVVEHMQKIADELKDQPSNPQPDHPGMQNPGTDQAG